MSSRLSGNDSLLRKFLWWGFMLASVYSASYLLANYNTVQSLFSFGQQPIIIGIVLFIIGIVIGMMFFLGWKGKGNRQELDGALDIFLNISKGYWITAFIFIIIVVIFVITISYINSTGQSWSEIRRFFLDSPGGFFGLITGFLTALGALVAVQTIIEMKRTITSYPQLLERLAELIQHAKGKQGTRIMCYSPLPGFWQVTSPELKSTLFDKLNMRNRRIQIICLNEQDHINWLLNIAQIRSNGNMKDPRRISPATLLHFQITCKTIIRNLNNNKIENFGDRATRLTWDQMPQYYFFVSTHRAIIVTPIRLPKLDEKSITIDFWKIIADQINENESKCINDSEPINHEDYESNFNSKFIEDLNKEINKKASSIKEARIITEDANISTLGFETNDRAIIDALIRLFDETKDIYGN
jgi:hypothetical protein